MTEIQRIQRLPTKLTKKFGGIVILIILIFGLVIFSIVNLAISWQTVAETEYAIEYDNWQNRVVRDSDGNVKAYGAGRHYVGLFGSFITFPATQITIEFSSNADSDGGRITGRTQDGLAIYLEISFQYQLQEANVGKLYTTYNTVYKTTFVKVARDVIRDVTSDFTAIQFFSNRSFIGSEMQDKLDAEFSKTYFANIPGFQLRSIDLPDSFEDALERAEVARQEIEIAHLNQQSTLVKAQTLILEADAAKNRTIINANASAEAFIIQMKAQASSVNITLSAEREAYYALAQALNMTSSELLAYLWIKALQEIGKDGNLVIVGQDSPSLILDPTGTSNSTITP